jgi:hypothetical protein
MDLLMIETTLLDPMLDATAWWHDTLSEWVYATAAARDAAEDEAADPIS